MDENKHDRTEETEEKSGPLTESENAGDGKKKRKKAPVRVRHCVLAACLAMGSFLGGVLTRQLMLDPELRSLEKLKENIQRYYYEEVTDEEFYNVIFEAVNENLLDDYSWYMNAEEYGQTKSEAKGEQSGLGLVFRTKAADGSAQMLVSRVCGNSPAEAAGLKAGDHVVGFGTTESEITESVQFNEFSDFLAEYGAGEEFCLLVRSGEDGSLHTVTIAKAQYVENYVFYRTQTASYRFTGGDALELTAQGDPLSALDADTAYIRLTKFNGAAAEEFDKAMVQFEKDGMKNLVLDLRGNGGGYLDIMQQIASYFCKNATASKPIAAVADYGEKKSDFRAKGNYYDEYFQTDSRICVLADSDTASASECLIGCMLDYGAMTYADICLAERNGEARTYGKGIMQTTYPLAGFSGDAVKLTTARIVWPLTGKCIHGVGILPSDGACTVEENPVTEAETAAAIRMLFS